MRTVVELRTILVAVVIYGAWIVLTYYYSTLPSWFVVPIAAYVITWHSSLQHECIHGHPTANETINRLIASLPLSLWLSYERYRSTHLAHHRTESLTDPVDDPESYYVTHAQWQEFPMLYRALLC